MGLVSGNRLNRFWKKGVKPIKDAIGVLSVLSTVDKSTLVAAINELADGKFDVAKLIASTNITEPGFAMDGKTAADALAELYSKTRVPHQVISVYSADTNDLPINSCGYTYSNTLNAPTNEGSIVIFTFGFYDGYKAQIAITMDNVVYTRRKNDATWTAWKTI